LVVIFFVGSCEQFFTLRQRCNRSDRQSSKKKIEPGLRLTSDRLCGPASLGFCCLLAPIEDRPERSPAQTRSVPRRGHPSLAIFPSAGVWPRSLRRSPHHKQGLWSGARAWPNSLVWFSKKRSKSKKRDVHCNYLVQYTSHQKKRQTIFRPREVFCRGTLVSVLFAVTTGSYRAVRFASPSCCCASLVSYISAVTRFSLISLLRQRVSTVST
jgi:hypothetical protein